ncbi:glutathione S-transferase [Ramaria rubella]|nr:glutathione S-transferase [Ramaria rubella]
MGPQVTLFSHKQGPDPIKISILLEELGVEYVIVNKEFGDGPNGVKHPDFLKYNPNGRVPVIIDHTNNDRNVWESGAILLYLAERFDKAGKIVGQTLDEKAMVWEWLFYQVSGLGPSQGQVNWFVHRHDVKELHPSVTERYINECYRIYNTLDKALEGQEYLVNGRFTVADIAYYPWIKIAGFATLDLSRFPNIQAYFERIKALPSVVKAYEKQAAAGIVIV